jgi:hypothetical protein
VPKLESIIISEPHQIPPKIPLLKFSARNMAQMIRLAFEQGVFAQIHMSPEKQINYLIALY